MIQNDRPIKLNSPRAWRTYTGGSNLNILHGEEPEITNFPEEWIMSMVSARNSGRESIKDEGLSKLVDYDEKYLKDIIDENASYYLGEEHVQKHDGLGILTKLIDSDERLTIQVHPDRKNARKLFNSEFGKTECWHILEDDTNPEIYIGFKKGITRKIWKNLFLTQDIAGMLSWLHKVEVKKGDTILIEGGVPHAIGKGCFLLEIQEPTDYTIRVEKVTPKGLEIDDFMCHQGLGFEMMFDCFDYIGISAKEVKDKWFINSENLFAERGVILNSLINYKNTDYFQLEKLELDANYKTKIGIENFAGMYILQGEGTVNSLKVKKGEQFFLPAGIDELDVEATKDMEVVIFYGPKV